MRIQKGTDAHRLSVAVGQAFAHIRREKGMTQSQVAESAGLQQAFISRFENGRTNPTLKTMSDIAAVFDCRPEITLVPAESDQTDDGAAIGGTAAVGPAGNGPAPHTSR